MFRWLFDTLDRRIRLEEREWRSQNRVRRDLAYRPWHSWLMRISGKPLHAAFTLTVLAIWLTAASWFIPPRWLHINTVSLSTTELSSYFFALWAVQSTIVALVYPIVIAFVTLLLQRRHNAKAPLHIYLHDSCAIFAGLSSLALVGMMGIHYLFFLTMMNTAGPAWLFIDAVWFLINVILSGVFLHRTFEFIRPESRMKVVHEYAINVAWPREMRVNLAAGLFINAPQAGLLPGPSFGSTTGGGEASIILGPVGGGMGSVVVEKILPRGSRLHDVRLRLLRWTVTQWFKRADTDLKEARTAGKGPIGRSGAPVIIFSLTPGSDYEGDTALCRIVGPVSLSRFKKRIVAASFSFRKARGPLLDLTVCDIVTAVQSEAMQAISMGETQLFEERIKELIELYSLLIEASVTTSDTGGKTDNYARSADRSQGFWGSVFDTWLKLLTDLSEAAAGKLSENSIFFIEMIFIPKWLFSKMADFAHPDILNLCIRLYSKLFWNLSTWWARTVEEQGEIKHDACTPVRLRPPFSATYNSNLIKFVSSWESLKNYEFPPTGDDLPAWKDLGIAAGYYEEHLGLTLVLVLYCVHRGDLEGAECMTDVLQKWFGELKDRHPTDVYVFRKNKLLNIELVAKEWDAVRNFVDIKFGVSEEDAPRAVFVTCLKNYWIDVCCVGMYVLVLWGRNCECKQSLPADLLRAIVNGDVLRPGGPEARELHPIKNADELFVAIVRQQYIDGGNTTGYRARLNQLVQRVLRNLEPEMISSRIYMGWGRHDLDSLRDGQLLVLLLFMKERWNPVREIEGILSEWVGKEDKNLEEFARDLDSWGTRFGQEEFAAYKPVYECAQKLNHQALTFEKAIEVAVEGIQGVVQWITDIREKAVREAPVSSERLDEIGKWGSKKAFSKEDGAFPIPLFVSVESSSNDYPTRSLLIQRINKGELTEPSMAQRSVNEEDWYENLVRNHVAASVMAEILQQLNPISARVNNPDLYWRQIKEFCAQVDRDGLQGVLLVENPGTPGWLREWRYPENGEPSRIPVDLRLSRNKDLRIDGYLGNIGPAWVFRAPLPAGASYLLVKEVLEKIEFSPYEDGRYVQVNVESISNDGLFVDLRLTWQFKVSVRKHLAVKLEYAKELQDKT